jgi:hypothetical protein
MRSHHLPNAFRVMILACVAMIDAATHQQDLSSLPLFDMSDMRFRGAFRIPHNSAGASSPNFSEGPLEYNKHNHSLFLVGHVHHHAIAEYTIPELVKSETLAELNMSPSPVQEFAAVFDRTPDGNPQNMNRVGGMELVDSDNGPQLIVNAYEYYDAPGNNTMTTLIVREPDKLASSAIDGFFAWSGGAGHTSGWISPIPTEWRDALAGSHITGQSSGIPIISRASVGPSAFAFQAENCIRADADTPIATVKLLDFSLANPLHDDLSNATGENDIWTHLTRVAYGMIIPGTRSYLTLGNAGGFESGVCYKCEQDNGHLCGGYCAPRADDYYLHYWLWDLNDMLDVKNGAIASHEVRPYAYGRFDAPFQQRKPRIGGGTYDPESGVLYLSLPGADREQGNYANPPVIIAYQFVHDATGLPATGLLHARHTPVVVRTTSEAVRLHPQSHALKSSNSTASLFDYRGRCIARATLRGSREIILPVRGRTGLILHISHQGTAQTRRIIAAARR